MAKPVIAVDIDDVLYPTAQHLADEVGKKYGVTVDAYRGDKRLRDAVADLTGIDPDEVAAASRAIFLHESFSDMAPFAEAVKAVRGLSEQYQIIAVTARSTESHDLTRKVVARDFGDLITEVYFPNTYEWIEPLVEIDKVPHLKEAGATWLIDDKLVHLLPLAGTDIRGGLFGDYPWNRGDEVSGNIERLCDWEAVLKRLMS